MREQRGHDVVRLVLGLFDDRAHRVGPAGAPVSSASASARQTEATEGCRPAFLPVLRVSFFAIPGTGTPLSPSYSTTMRRPAVNSPS
ncbi:hypothetical protein ABZ896_38400 [Streptomyces sp. NPDC047072]|uniref:hypothetical protein n=1 Tax=Streptomyces sp. NPDC047072 TaxID=3154809 RepID=UPI003401EB75